MNDHKKLVPVKFTYFLDFKTDELLRMKSQIDQELQERLVSILSRHSMNALIELPQLLANLISIDDNDLFIIRDSECQFSRYAVMELQARNRRN